MKGRKEAQRRKVGRQVNEGGKEGRSRKVKEYQGREDGLSKEGRKVEEGRRDERGRKVKEDQGRNRGRHPGIQEGRMV
jgi:hypothetical protein